MNTLPAVIPGTKAKRIVQVREGVITSNNRLYGLLVEADPRRRWPAGTQLLSSPIVAVRPHMDGTLRIETQNTIYEVVSN